MVLAGGDENEHRIGRERTDEDVREDDDGNESTNADAGKYREGEGVEFRLKLNDQEGGQGNQSHEAQKCPEKVFAKLPAEIVLSSLKGGGHGRGQRAEA